LNVSKRWNSLNHDPVLDLEPLNGAKRLDDLNQVFPSCGRPERIESFERLKLFRKHVTRFDKRLWYRGSFDPEQFDTGSYGPDL